MSLFSLQVWKHLSVVVCWLRRLCLAFSALVSSFPPTCSPISVFPMLQVSLCCSSQVSETAHFTRSCCTIVVHSLRGYCILKHGASCSILTLQVASQSGSAHRRSEQWVTKTLTTWGGWVYNLPSPGNLQSLSSNPVLIRGTSVSSNVIAHWLLLLKRPLRSL